VLKGEKGHPLYRKGKGISRQFWLVKNEIQGGGDRKSISLTKGKGEVKLTVVSKKERKRKRGKIFFAKEEGGKRKNQGGR